MNRFLRLTLESTPAGICEASARLQELGIVHGLDETALFHLDLCANELLANVAAHAYRGGIGKIDVELLLSDGTATLDVIDAGPQFDPLTVVQPPAPQSLEVAPIGGLGVHLVRRFADSMVYERCENCNRVTVRIVGDVAPASGD